MSEPEFKILTDKEHAIQNSDMYIGSVNMETHELLIDGEFKEMSYVPGLVKITDEVIDNCVDEAIRTNFKHANAIQVSIVDNTIKISDNGRGIPQDDIKTPTGETEPRPLAAWTRARAGSNFTKDRKTIGKNGVGSALTNFFSTNFIGETCDGTNKVTVRCTNNADNVSYTKSKSKIQGTTVTFVPDFTQFGVFTIDDTFETIVYNRLITLAVNFPNIKFKFNNKIVNGKFSTFIKQFGETYSESKKSHSMFIATSNTGFRNLSFVNGVHTKQGGTHVDGIMNAIADELIPLVKRKHKIEINRARVRESMFIGLFLREFVAAKFDSQTKERLTSTWAQVRDHMGCDFKKIAKKILETDALILPVIESALARKMAADKAAAAKAQKNAKRAKVAKHIKASGLGKKKTSLFVTEGDSAMGYFIKVRDNVTQGGYPLRGKILNVWNKSDAEVLKTKEIIELLAIFDVKLNELRAPAYDNICIMTDADVDGKGSIYPLFLCFIYKYWKHWFDENRIHFVKTPEWISTNGKKVVWHYSHEDHENHKFRGKWEHRHIKGLGSLTEEEYEQCIKEPMLETVQLDDNAHELFELLFGDDADKRKEWLE